MANEYEVPVWFRVNGDSQDAAWVKIRKLLNDLEQFDQLPEYVVEEPVEILPMADAGWNRPPA